ncbi:MULTISPECIES: hypothetical protein [unclassified Lentimonas]|uniref:hypothetical protein n=1 Tax=unclassified Lentimonas TaxID=2630993 RepID=UPI0013251127|nr:MULTISPECIES: hypothetical protein [unclassified Lentimonas]CAA6677153.1 Unannotated [Lentimonas sp. CC4]CAA6686223.1 Unannotated [Lentimonas sp. CC6]CAA7074253.1 Unannotated [Lentimonas sp. CC4]CAA7171084.1 Unannotated [Lentimonas sp. CC21]CAA7182887.1 Unannotated [Lentimonas sp. CC8]
MKRIQNLAYLLISACMIACADTSETAHEQEIESMSEEQYVKFLMEQVARRFGVLLVEIEDHTKNGRYQEAIDQIDTSLEADPWSQSQQSQLSESRQLLSQLAEATSMAEQISDVKQSAVKEQTHVPTPEANLTPDEYWAQFQKAFAAAESDEEQTRLIHQVSKPKNFLWSASYLDQLTCLRIAPLLLQGERDAALELTTEHSGRSSELRKFVELDILGRFETRPESINMEVVKAAFLGAAELGQAASQSCYGLILANQYPEREHEAYSEALSWLEQAANQGDALCIDLYQGVQKHARYVESTNEEMVEHEQNRKLIQNFGLPSDEAITRFQNYPRGTSSDGFGQSIRMKKEIETLEAADERALIGLCRDLGGEVDSETGYVSNLSKLQHEALNEVAARRADNYAQILQILDTTIEEETNALAQNFRLPSDDTPNWPDDGLSSNASRRAAERYGAEAEHFGEQVNAQTIADHNALRKLASDIGGEPERQDGDTLYRFPSTAQNEAFGQVLARADRNQARHMRIYNTMEEEWEDWNEAEEKRQEYAEMEAELNREAAERRTRSKASSDSYRSVNDIIMNGTDFGTGY